MFPQKTLEEQLARTVGGDPLTVEYLRVLLAARPDSPRLRILLARQLMQSRRYAEARAALRPLASTEQSPLRVEAEIVEFQSREREAYEMPAGSPERARATAMARDKLSRLVQLPLDSAQLTYVAARAVALQEAPLAVRLYQRMAVRGELRGAQANSEAGALVLGFGGYAVAAQFYFRAQEQSADRATKRAMYVKGLSTLVAGGLHDQAIVEADRRLGAFSADRETLLYLTRMARAANRADAAQRYARMLLQMALLRQLESRIARIKPIPAVFEAPRLTRASTAPKAPGLPFDEEAYTLGYDVFVGAGNLAEAFKVAESAVAQAPQSAEWRKRLAEVAEWSGRPVVALAQWLAHARIAGEEASWDAVLRLSQGLQDDAALLAVLSHRMAREPDSAALIDRIIALHERQGRPDDAIAVLQGAVARARGDERRRRLEQLAALAERAGRGALIFATWDALQREFGPTLGYATKLALRHTLAGDLRAAFAALDAVVGLVPAGEAAYWQHYVELARLLQFDAKALAAYQRLLVAEKFSAADLQNIIALLDAMHPGRAARVAEFAFARFGAPDIALQVLYQHGRVNDRASITRFLAGLPPAIRAVLERDARFLLVRAAHHGQTGDPRRSLADFKAANALDPGNPDTQAALIWTLIGLRDGPALNTALSAFAPAARTEPKLWGPFAAAHMALNRQGDALRWFRRQAGSKDDYLWLMAYAECLDANSMADAAWHIRRKGWLELRRPEVLARIPEDQLISMRDRLSSVAQIFVAGDRARLLVEALLRADLAEIVKPGPAPALPATGAELVAALEALQAQPQFAAAAPKTLPASWFTRDKAPPLFPAADNAATVKELALAWALNTDAQELARAWLVSRFAASLSRPLWGELSVALAAGDRVTLTRLLDDLPDWLPMYDRVEAALRIGRPALAMTLAFEQFDHLQFDEQLHERFTGMATADPARVAGGLAGIRQSPLSISQRRVEASADLSPRLKLGLTLTENRQSTQDETRLINLPERDTTISAFARYRFGGGVATLAAFQREAMRQVNGLKLDYDLVIAPRLRLSGSAGINLTSPELAILRVGGIKNSMENALTWNLSNREYLRFGLAWNSYRTQDHTRLGRATSYSVEAGHRIRLEYPDFNLRVFDARYNFTSSGQSDALIASLLPAALRTGDNTFLPSSYTQWGAAFGWGQYLPERYSRAWRPFFDMSFFRNSLTGAGRGVRLGAAGSVFGQDHAAFYFGQSTGTPGSPQGYREFGLTYQWFY